MCRRKKINAGWLVEENIWTEKRSSDKRLEKTA
jgi:hypothetical protein